jgi:hypothetical protein
MFGVKEIEQLRGVRTQGLASVFNPHCPLAPDLFQFGSSALSSSRLHHAHAPRASPAEVMLSKSDFTINGAWREKVTDERKRLRRSLPPELKFLRH